MKNLIRIRALEAEVARLRPLEPGFYDTHCQWCDGQLQDESEDYCNECEEDLTGEVT